MTLIGLLIFGIIGMSYLIPYIFIKIRSKNAISKILKESTKYNNLENFIAIKKYEFENFDKSSIALLSFFVVLFLAAKITGFISIIIYIISSVGFVCLLSTYINFRKPREKVLELLYQRKDKQKKK